MEKLKKLKTKYFSLSVAVRAAVWFTFCNLLQKGITMISMPIFTRLLTTEQYGEFTVYQSWYSIINVIVAFNIRQFNIKWYVKILMNRRNNLFVNSNFFSLDIIVLLHILYPHNFFNHILAFRHYLWLQCFAQMLLNLHIFFFGRKGKDADINIKEALHCNTYNSSLGPVISALPQYQRTKLRQRVIHCNSSKFMRSIFLHNSKH